MTPDKIHSVVRASRSIEGWLSPDAARSFGWIDSIQHDEDVRGDVFEIGAHHGRSTALLSWFCRADETLGVCDLFGDQASNVSGSGCGDRAVFEGNMRRLGPDGLRLRVFAKPSQELTAEDTGRNVRFFHVDGGHLVEEVLNDLRIAAAVICERGVIAVDDAFNIEWPGVIEGIVEFLHERTDLCALALGFNKMYITSKAAAAMYHNHFFQEYERRRFGMVTPIVVKRMKFVGVEMRVYTLSAGRQTLRQRIEGMYCRTPWLHHPRLRPIGRLVKRLVG